MATITKRANGWQAQVRRKGYPAVSKVFDDRQDAQAWAKRTEAQMALGQWQTPGTVTLSDVLDRYKSEHLPKLKSKVQTAPLVDRVGAAFFSGSTLDAIKPSDVAAWRDELSRTMRANTGGGAKQLLSPTTVRLLLATLSSVYTFARCDMGLPVSNPVAAIRKPSATRGRERRVEKNRDGTSELDTVLAGVRSTELKAFVLLAIETAARRGELCKLQWADVDLVGRLAVLRDTKNGSTRAIPLSSRAVEILSALCKSEGAVFTLKMRSFTTMWRAACGRAGVKNLRLHDLRHEGVSRLFERGLNTIEVASVSGHQTLQMLKRYAHVRPESLLAKLD